MQDKYVGDIGDFGKYGLLCELMQQAGPHFRLGINWYFTNHLEFPNNDGGHIGYLDEIKSENKVFKSCNSTLYKKLQYLVTQGKRTVREVERHNVLPEKTSYFSIPIPHTGTSSSDRVKERQNWFRQSFDALKDADIVFLDPDNGICLDQSIKGKPIGVKYAFIDEMESLYRAGKTLVIYNHRDRRPRHEYEMKILTGRHFVTSLDDIRILRFRRGSARDYIFISHKEHRGILESAISQITSPPWDYMFEIYSVKEEKYMAQSKRFWTHPSVLAMAGKADPIDAVVSKARAVVLNALQAGWSGPPYDPIRLAEYLRTEVVPNAEIFEARTIPRGLNHFRIEFNPHKPRNRVKFSLAHELAHILFPDCNESIRERSTQAKLRNDEWQLELLCNVAAAEFLMPLGTWRNFEREPVTIDNIVRLQREYEVSTEALSIRMADLTNEPCTIFVSARASDDPASGFRVDYSIPSRTANFQIPKGFLIPQSNVMSECLAIGYTAKGEEHWQSLPEMSIECTGLPPYPGSKWPRILGIARSKASKPSKIKRINYLYGDALEPRGKGIKIIAHIVNDGTPNWGRGFPVALKTKWPEIQDDFRVWAKASSRNLSLGNIYAFSPASNILIFHMIAQSGFGYSAEPRIRYASLKQCLDKLAAFAEEKSASIHMPMIGTGQAGGKWEIIADLIDDSLVKRNIEVTIYVLPSTPMPLSAIQDLFLLSNE
jgi:O-acetyl-ADP-ribose deacetylase (regulator of RNase III)